MSKGKLLEILVKQIETSLRENDQVSVTTDVKLKDKDGVLRQIDVLVTIEFGKRLGKAYVIIECKDRARKAEVGHIGTFINLVESIPECTKGIYVSKKGFNSGAITKAEANKKVELFYLKNDSGNITDKLFCSNVFKIGYEIPDQNFEFQMKTSHHHQVWNSVDEIQNTMLFNNSFEYQNCSPTDWPFINGTRHSTTIVKQLQDRAKQVTQDGTMNCREEITIEFSFDNDWYVNTKGFNWTPIRSLSMKIQVDFKAIPSIKSTFYEYQELNKESDATGDLFEFPHHYLQVIKPKDESLPRFFVIMKNDLTDITEIVKLDSFLDRPPNGKIRIA